MLLSSRAMACGIVTLGAATALGAAVALAFGAAALPLKTIATVPLPGGSSRLDYASVDSKRNRLYIAHLGGGLVIAFDTKNRRVVKRGSRIPAPTRTRSPTTAGHAFTPARIRSCQTRAPSSVANAYTDPSNVDVKTMSFDTDAQPKSGESRRRSQSMRPVAASRATSRPLPRDGSTVVSFCREIALPQPHRSTTGTNSRPSAYAMGVSTPPSSPGHTVTRRRGSGRRSGATPLRWPSAGAALRGDVPSAASQWSDPARTRCFGDPARTPSRGRRRASAKTPEYVGAAVNSNRQRTSRRAA